MSAVAEPLQDSHRETVYHQCPGCGTVNTGTDPDAVIHCGEKACGWDPKATDAKNRTTAQQFVLMTREQVEAYYAERAPVPPPDWPKKRALQLVPEGQPPCAVCGGALPFAIPLQASPDVSWRCSQACSLAVLPSA